MLTQPLSRIITSSLGVICITSTPTKEKKSRKPKIPSIFSTKKVVAEVKHSALNDLVDSLANVMGSIFLQSIRN